MARGESTDSKRSRIHNWDDQRDEILLDVLKQQKSLGQGVGGHFRHDSWRAIVKAFNHKTNLSLSQENLRNRLKNLKRNFFLYQSIIRRNGWIWDDDRNFPKPETPSNWDEIITVNPKYAKCERKPFPRFRDMEFLYGEKGMIEWVISPNPAQQETETSFEEQPSSFSSEQRITYNVPVSEVQVKGMDIDQEQAEICQEKSERVTESRTNAYLIEDCMKKLEKVKGISPEAFVAACDCFKDKDNRTIFMNLDGLYLEAWVERQLKIDQQRLQPLSRFHP